MAEKDDAEALLYGDLDDTLPDAPTETSNNAAYNRSGISDEPASDFQGTAEDDDDDEEDDDEEDDDGFGILLGGAATPNAPGEAAASQKQAGALNEQPTAEGDLQSPGGNAFNDNHASNALSEDHVDMRADEDADALDEEDDEDDEDDGFSIVMANAEPPSSKRGGSGSSPADGSAGASHAPSTTNASTSESRNKSTASGSSTRRRQKPPVPPLQLDDGTWLTFNGHAPLARYDEQGRRQLPGGIGGSRYIPPDQYKEFLQLGNGGILDLDLSNTDIAPWRTPGADISDFFNYGFTEDTWTEFEHDVRRERLKRFHTYTRFGQQPEELYANFPLHNIRVAEAEPRNRAVNERIKPISQIQILAGCDEQEDIDIEKLHGEGSLVQAMIKLANDRSTR